MLCLKTILHRTGKVVVLDYVFYVPQGYADMNNKGLNGATLINKRHYCPSYIECENQG